MAAQHDDYRPGDMDIADQTATYAGFMVWLQWGSVLTAGVILAPTLIFGAHVPWLQAVLGSGALALGAGLAMRMGTAFALTTVAFTLVGLVSGGIAALVSSLS